MKLELKHLAPYLPYSLKVEFQNANRFKEVSLLEPRDLNDVYTSDIKPILRPLSDLTKGIEYDGETFEPLWRLKTQTIWSDAYTEWWDYQYPDYESMMLNCPQEIFLKLIEWHFDVFGLIEKGLAIDINTIKD